MNHGWTSMWMNTICQCERVLVKGSLVSLMLILHAYNGSAFNVSQSLFYYLPMPRSYIGKKLG